MTGRELVTDALIDLGVIGVGDPLDAAVAEHVRRKANDWIDSLALDRLTMFVLLRTVHTLTASTVSYTIGTGGDINIVRPTEIEAAGLIIDSSADPKTEIPIDVFTEQRWQRIRQKDLDNSLAGGVYYDHGSTAGLGRVYPWPVPSVPTTQLVLYTPVALTEFANLNTDYHFARGYKRYLKTNLLKEIAGMFGKVLTGEQVAAARDAEAKIKRSNIRPMEARVDRALLSPTVGAWDWRTGE